MANPNIVNVSTINANTTSITISSTADPFATALVNNPAASGKVYKINSILVANIDGAASTEITIKIFSQDDLAGTGSPIIYQIPVPADSTFVALDKGASIYLLEDRSIGVTASAANDLVVTASWEEIS